MTRTEYIDQPLTREELRQVTRGIILIAFALGALLARAYDNSYYPSYVSSPSATAFDPYFELDTTSASNSCSSNGIEPWDEVEVDKGCRIIGDIDVEVRDLMIPLFDRGNGAGNTGTLTLCLTRCRVWATYGAHVSSRSIADLAFEMHSSGCVGGCKSVRLFVMRGSDIVRTYTL